MPTKIAAVLAVLFITGCSSYADQQITSTKAAGSVLDSDTSYFCQDASYATRDSVYRGGEVLSHLLGFWKALGVVLVRFKPLSQDEFQAEYLDKDLNIVDSRHFVKGVDFQVQDDGGIEIKTASRCGGGDGPGVGCSWSKVRIFIDQAGNLAVVQATGGAGLLGLVPVSSSSKYLSLFPPIKLSDGSAQAGLAQCPESRASKSRAEYEKHKVLPTFAVGDVVIPYRHFDHKKKEFLPGPAKGLEGTKWLVKEITVRHVRVDLIEGEYNPGYPKGVIHRAGAYSTLFASSNGYKATNRYGGDLGQVFEEFKKAD